MSKLYVFLFFVFYALVVTVGRKQGYEAPKKDGIAWKQNTTKNWIKDF